MYSRDYSSLSNSENKTEEKLNKIAEELHNIAIELRSYNEIGRELLQIQRNMFAPPTNNRDFYFDDRRIRY